MTSKTTVSAAQRPFSWVRVAAILVICATAGLLIYKDKTQEWRALCADFNGEQQQVLSACDKMLAWVARTPEARSLIYRHRMRVFLSHEDWGAAKREADFAIAETPENAVPWQWKGMTLARAEEYSEALQAIEMSLDLAPGNDYSLETKAKLLRNMDRFDEIEPLVEKAVGRYEVGPWAWRYAGYFRLKREKYRAAAIAFAEALRSDPEHRYGRRKFFEACREAGSECPSLFPHARAYYPQLACEDASDKWEELYPKLAEGLVSNSESLSLSDVFTRGGLRAKTLVQVVYLGPAADIETKYTLGAAEKFVVVNRVFDCVNGGEFVFPDGVGTDAEMKFANEHLHGPELRANLLDLIYAQQK